MDAKTQKRGEENVLKFMQIMSEACEDMISQYQKLDQTSKQIKATAKILPHLLSESQPKAI
jgi:hypothetical protein